MNPEKWESLDALNKNSGVMVSNLPLLFTHGYPTSILKMTQVELEAFVPFMVRCSLGEDMKTAWSDLPRPSWWPTKLPFRLPSARYVLVKIVERCYTFHGCEYLLNFCKSLVKDQPASGYRFTDNRDGTSSMYDGTTGKLLVTFRNENREYDKLTLHKNQISQKKLLPSSTVKNGAMVRNPISDVYLCDKCDDEFSTLKEVQIHEKTCCGDRPESPKLPSPEPELFEEEQDTGQQVPFLSYLGLEPGKHTGVAPYKSPRKRVSVDRKGSFGSSYSRYEAIGISSPLGRFILSKSKLGGRFQLPLSNVLKYERHVYASLENDFVSTRESARIMNRWVTIWRQSKKQPWNHLYSFNSKHKAERLKTIESGLDFQSRQLLSKCKRLKVRLKRLPKRTIDRTTRLGDRCVPCIDLTSPDETSQNLFDPLGLIPFNHSLFGTDHLSFPKYEVSPVNGMLVPGSILTFDSNDVNDEHLKQADKCMDRLSTFGCTIKKLESRDQGSQVCGTKRPNSLPDLKSHKKLKLNYSETLDCYNNAGASWYADSSPIEVIELSSDDDSNSFNHNDISSSLSKNGYSHWSPKDCLFSCGETKSKSAVNGVKSYYCYQIPDLNHSSCSLHHCSAFKSRSHEMCVDSKNKLSFPFRHAERICSKDKVFVSKIKRARISTRIDDEITFNEPIPKEWVYQENNNSIEYSEMNELGFLGNLASKSLNYIRSFVDASVYSTSKEKCFSGTDESWKPNFCTAQKSLNTFEGHNLKTVPNAVQSSVTKSCKVSLSDTFRSRSEFVLPGQSCIISDCIYSTKEKLNDSSNRNFIHPKNSGEKKMKRHICVDKISAANHNVLNEIRGQKTTTTDSRPHMSKELKNLARDECKELKNLGFHPADILGSSNLLNNNNNNNVSFCCNENPSSSPRSNKKSLISYKRFSPPKKPNEFTGQESVKQMMEGNKKLSRELCRLMNDEWKELKKCGSHPSQLPQLLSNERSLRSLQETMSKPSALGHKSNFVDVECNNNDWSLSRSTRGQAKKSVAPLETPRTVHRNLIQSEEGMCVINYDDRC